MANDEWRMTKAASKKLRGWLGALALGGLCIVHQGSWAQTGVKIQLVSEVTAIVPGEPFYVGLFIQHEAHYHTYWKQPGIVGVPTQIRWKLPPGFEAGDLEYPEPESVLMFRIKAQGFERDVLLQTRITPPKNLQPGERVTLTGKASWMACAQTCHPGNMDLSLELPVGASSLPDPKWQPVFEKERAAFAQPSGAWAARAVEKDLEMTLHLSPKTPEARAFASGDEVQKLIFFTEDGWIHSDEPQEATLHADGSLTIKLIRADIFLGKGIPERLLGIVQYEGGWLKDGKLRSLRIAPLIERPAKERS